MPELVHPEPISGASADVHLDRLLAAGVEEPWYKSLIQNIKDAVNPPKLPPLVLTSKPVAVKDSSSSRAVMTNCYWSASLFFVLFFDGHLSATEAYFFPSLSHFTDQQLHRIFILIKCYIHNHTNYGLQIMDSKFLEKKFAIPSGKPTLTVVFYSQLTTHNRQPT